MILFHKNTQAVLQNVGQSGKISGIIFPELLLEDKIDRPDQAKETEQMVQAQLLVFKEQEHEQREDHQSDYLLQHFQFHQ